MVKRENKRFVMLVEKAGNGKIVKNEQYTIDEFTEEVFPKLSHGELPRFSRFDKFFNTYNYKEYKVCLFEKRIKQAVEFAIRVSVRHRIHQLITLDTPGRKK